VQRLLVELEQQRGADDADRRGRHGGAGEPGGEPDASEWEQDAGGDGHAQDVVAQGPHVVQPDPGEGLAREIDGGDHILEAALHQDDVSGLNGNVCASAKPFPRLPQPGLVSHLSRRRPLPPSALASASP